MVVRLVLVRHQSVQLQIQPILNSLPPFRVFCVSIWDSLVLSLSSLFFLFRVLLLSPKQHLNTIISNKQTNTTTQQHIHKHITHSYLPILETHPAQQQHPAIYNAPFNHYIAHYTSALPIYHLSGYEWPGEDRITLQGHHRIQIQK